MRFMATGMLVCALLLAACGRPIERAPQAEPSLTAADQSAAPYALEVLHSQVREAVLRAREAAAAAAHAEAGHVTQTWPNGDRFAGQTLDGQKSGYGVYEFADGRRYEGAYLNDAPHGWGVDWTASGAVARQGRFDRRRLVERVGAVGSTP